MTILFLIATIIIFLSLDMLYRHRLKKKPSPVVPTGVTKRKISLKTPEGIFFTPSHLWLNLFPSGTLLLGIDDFVGMVLRNPSITLHKKEGDKVVRGESLFTIEDGNHSLTVQSPMDAELLIANDELIEAPEMLKDSSFTDGWIYTLKPATSSDLKSFLLGPESKRWMADEVRRLRDFLTSAGPAAGLVPATLPDGGLPAADMFQKMDPKIWKKFEEEFLRMKKS